MRTAQALAILALLAACTPGSQKSGPEVARGDGISITAGEFKARLEEQSPFIRARYSTLERKKEFLDNLIRTELLARAAEKQGLDKDPEVLGALRKIMVQKLVQRIFAEGDAAKEIAEPEARKFYQEHQDDYVKPRKVRLAHILLAAPPGPDRARAASQAKKLLARVKSEEAKNPLAFGTLAREVSQDPATKTLSGDLGFKGQGEIEKQFGKPFADAAFALKNAEEAVLESPQGFHVVKLTSSQDAIDRPFEAVKAQIQTKLYREKRTRDFEEFVKKLREEARVTVDEAELEKVTISGATGLPPGVPGMPFGAGGGPLRPTLPAPPPAPAPAPAPPAGPAK